jgi:hypothetical protein
MINNFFKNLLYCFIEKRIIIGGNFMLALFPSTYCMYSMRNVCME